MAIENASTLETLAESSTYAYYDDLTAQQVYDICYVHAEEGRLQTSFTYTDKEVSYSNLQSIVTELETYDYICELVIHEGTEYDYPVLEKYVLNISWDVT